MLPEGLLDQVAQASPLAFVLVALVGLTVGVAPSSLPLAAVVAGWAAGRRASASEARPARREWRSGLLPSAGFVLGMATVDALIGGLFGLLGFALIAVLAEYRALVNVVAALVLLVLGLALLRAIRIAVPVLRPAVRPAASFGSAYALGVPFGLSTCPVCTPMVLPVMAAAAATGTPLLGAGLLFTFGFARGVPLILLGMFAGMAQALRGAGQWVARIERAGGALLLLAAAYFLYQGGVHARLLPALPFGGFES